MAKKTRTSTTNAGEGRRTTSTFEDSYPNILKVRKLADIAAFLASLSNRRLELRSALGSFAVLRHFPAHDHHDDRLQLSLSVWEALISNRE